MPYYDLRCEKCQEEFTVKASIQSRSDKTLRCPACGSSELATVYRKVNILKYTGKACDACSGPSQVSGGGCGCNGGCCGHAH